MLIDLYPKGILEVILYIHIPFGEDNDCLDDEECLACKISKQASDSYFKVYICEKSLN